MITESEKQKLFEYKIAEQQVLNKIFKKEIDLVENFERYDHICNQKKWLIELKNREFSYDEFMTKYKGQMFIENEKYWRNYLLAREMSYNFLYVFKFTCGKVMIINLSSDDFNPQYFYENKLLCPEYSFKDTKKMIYKDVYIIPKRMYNEKNCRVGRINTNL